MACAQQQLDYFTGPCPCDDCRFRERCGPERLACQAFSMFLHDESEARWRNAPRAPSRALYEAALGEDSAPRIGRPQKVNR
jgi:hypothetical protein